jgi:hypothetical protein
MMWLEGCDDEISFIHDYRHVCYIVTDVELALASEAEPAGDGAGLALRGPDPGPQ